jgi:2-methylisocitrate lyase-like PEP mutase family enzyme
VLAVQAGFAAPTVGCHPMADSIGKPDNGGMTFGDALTRVTPATRCSAPPFDVLMQRVG